MTDIDRGTQHAKLLGDIAIGDWGQRQPEYTLREPSGYTTPVQSGRRGGATCLKERDSCASVEAHDQGRSCVTNGGARRSAGNNKDGAPICDRRR
jgi:hypothetical protein